MNKYDFERLNDRDQSAMILSSGIIIINYQQEESDITISRIDHTLVKVTCCNNVCAIEALDERDILNLYTFK